MKLNESNLADPLLLSGCPLGGPAWGTGSFGGQELISTTTSTFSEDNLILPPTPSSGGSTSLSCKSGTSPPSSGHGVELDALLIVQSSDSFAELKPLPPFEYANPTVQLTLHNDPRLPQMGSTTATGSSPSQSSTGGRSANNSSSNNNNSNIHAHNNHSHSSGGNNAPNNLRHGGSGGSTGGSSIVSSPTGNFSSSSVGGSPSSLFDAVSSSTTPVITPNIKSELADYLLNSDIDDIAALIGNAIADSTVPNLGIELDPNGVTSSTIDPWTELDAWIESACQQTPGQPQMGGTNVPGNGPGPGGRGQTTGILLDQDATIHTSAADHAFLDGNSSTLQTLLEADSFSGGSGGNNIYHHHHPDMKQEFHNNNHSTSILQSRLQQPIPGQLLRISGGPNTSPSQMPESTTHHHYGLKVDPYTLDHPGSPTYIDPITGEVTQRPHTTHVSPPVVTSTMMSNGSSKYRKQYKLSSNNKGSSPTSSGGSYHDGSNNFISQFGPNSYDHHHHSSHNGLGNQVSYATSSHIGPPWSSHAHNQPHHSWRREQSKMGIKTKRKSSKLPSSAHTIELDPLGKEKPIHRCGICNRGFLNKSNIKVHLRTHTGEKPFKCEVCGKAFRQKAHLLKHVQIHKRITRD
ncbi:ichor isoform X1 [Folsomia candida]|uniref:ichor isoform X1 n=1 Tax=Folsomia candida TaxID=158441 RepID=UPI001604A7B5|nr:ichor isoform X1 [Folsomia candida]